jgi:hypothetical protein
MMNLRKAFALSVLLALCTFPGFAKKKEEPKTESSKVVDAGSFGIYVNGKRVATETFKIEQGAAFSTAKSEIKTDPGGPEARQESELEIGANSELRRYHWRQTVPAKSELVVEPSGEFLVEHIVPEPPQKPADQVLLLAHSTAILDDYSFSQRELLVWRYLAEACGTHIEGCTLPRTVFGAVVPAQRISVSVAVSYKGKQTVSLKGQEQQLDCFEISTEGDLWEVYLDSNMKMVKVVVPGDNTEAVRD